MSRESCSLDDVAEVVRFNVLPFMSSFDIWCPILHPHFPNFIRPMDTLQPGHLRETIISVFSSLSEHTLLYLLNRCSEQIWLTSLHRVQKSSQRWTQVCPKDQINLVHHLHILCRIKCGSINGYGFPIRFQFLSHSRLVLFLVHALNKRGKTLFHLLPQERLKHTKKTTK